MSYLVLGLFCAALTLCVILKLSIIYALLAGLVLFFGYARLRGCAWRELGRMCASGLRGSRNVLLNFVLIGMLTAAWRASGTIPVIVCASASAIRPSVFLLMAFVLNCGVAFLTGTAFGTSATMGVICMTLAGAAGIDPAMAGGAVLSGCYFGDRLSPVSTSAMLAAELTKTDLFGNIRNMAASCAVPAAASCAIYGAAGIFSHGGGTMPQLGGIFAREFSLSPLAVLPAAILFALALMRFKVKYALGAGILAALPAAVFLQGMSAGEFLLCLWKGYAAQDAQLAKMLDGGGISSMLRLIMILSISSAYAGVFRQTDLLDGLHRLVGRLASATSVFTATYVTSLGASAVACNQTLSIILTHQLCSDLAGDKSEAALNLEDSAVVSAPYYPWSIAAATPLTSMGAPGMSILAAFYVFLLPLYRVFTSLRAERAKRVSARRRV